MVMANQLQTGMGYTTVNQTPYGAPPTFAINAQTSGALGASVAPQAGAAALLALLGGLFILYWATRNIQGL